MPARVTESSSSSRWPSPWPARLVIEGPRVHTRHISRQAKVGDDWTKTASTKVSYLQGNGALLEEISRQAGHRVALWLASWPIKDQR
jgi:hypothetical protein